VLRVGTYTDTQTNNGILEATNGGILRIGGGQNNQSASGITRAVGAGSIVEVQNAGGFNGGRVETSNGGQIRAGGAVSDFTRLVDVVVNADFVVMPRTRLLPGGTVTNNGTITLKPGEVAGSNTDVEWQGSATLTGTGVMVLESTDLGQSRVFTAAGAVHGAAHTMAGSGTLFYTGSLTNNGTLAANVSGRMLNVSPFGTPNSLANPGTFKATGGGILNVTGTPTNFAAGTLTGGAYEVYGASTLRLTNVNIATNAATILLDGAGSNLYNASTGTTSALAPLASNAGHLTIRNGRDLATTGNLSNSGVLVVGDNSTLTVNGILTNTGKIGGTGRIVALTTIASNGSRLTPGNSPGKLTIEGNLELDNGVIYEWEVGTVASDLIDVIGNLSFAQTATLEVLPFGPEGAVGGDYVLFSVTGLIGTLPNWTINLPQGWDASGIAVQGQNVVLQALTVPEPGVVGMLPAAGGLMLRRRSR
jgi:hypothetical protein